MNPATLTAVGGIVVPLLAVVILPLMFRRQSRKNDQEIADRLATAKREADEQQAIKENAARDAKLAEGDVVSWEKINQRLTITADRTEVAHQRRLAELREDFAEEVVRTKRQTDYELDRAKQEIGRLADRVEELTRQIIALGTKSER